jgi:hypothetical protein
MTDTANWLTPETAIGATLPCGAKVVRAALDDDGDIQVWFDQPPVDGAGRQSHRCGQWYFKPDGTGDCFPPLIRAADMTIDWSRPIVTNAGKPARVQAMIDTPQPITHAAIVAAVERLPEHLDGPAAIADALCVQLGVEVPEKRAPWEVAYEAWRLPGKSDAVHERVWRAAVEWFVEQIDEASDINDRCNSPKFVEGYRCAFKAVRQTIMGPEQQP